MIFQQKEFRSNFKILFTFIFIYVVLFEFVLPVNRVLPKPSMLFESLFSVWQDYSLLYHFSLSVTVIYGSIFAGYFLVHFFAGKLIWAKLNYGGIFRLLNMLSFLPFLIYALVLTFWFPHSFYAELLLFFSISTGLFIAALLSAVENTKEEYILAAKGLNLSDRKICSSVIWKSSQPSVTNEFVKIHSVIWGFTLIYEFIGNNTGLGLTFRQMLEFNDLAGICALALIVSIVIIFGNFLLKYVRSKMVFWE